MEQRRLPHLTAAALVSAVLLAGCTVQDQPQQPPEPSGSASEVSSAAAAPVSGTYTGTQIFELGTPPAEATEIAVEITCLDAGTLSLPGGAKVTCQDSNEAFATGIWSLPLTPGQHSLEVQASEPAISYEVKIAYADK
ncbi:hypothetical protein [Arthrobacter sp. zg-Y769]|uniref:hypothetical protein n=1 Tax=Arthrobacter sp. zg-Y769 TaxID=2894191 RepID=UPI001E3034E7|nr:hypothetical protein [Arthrobacter sp. zg-Y769]MCC9206130.1 hypothetical protein [Arthrobacter sp. zg-Y769]